MARMNNTLWNRYKFKLNGLVLLLSVYFLYKALTPEFPDSFTPKQLGTFEVSPMPYNLDPPYLHDGHYTKDFFITFSKGNVSDIRQAYLNIGKQAIALTILEQDHEGILHGSQHGQEVHGISPKTLVATDKVWLTIETWQGDMMVTHWDLPKALLE